MEYFLQGLVALILVLAGFWFFFRIYRPLKLLEEKMEHMERRTDSSRRKGIAGLSNILEEVTCIMEQREEELKREHTRIILEQQMRYTQLQNQINPHFLYNTLENIRGQAIIDDQEKIAEMTEALSRFFRYNISKDNDIVYLYQELENVKTYIQIQQYRFTDRFVFEIYNHDDSGQALQCRIPKMTLQPIVENAIFHGMERKIEQGHIHLHIELSSEHIVILVEDDGIGMSEETLRNLRRKIGAPLGEQEMLDVLRQETEEEETDGHGIAMKNINTRLRLLYGDTCGIHISSIESVGTEVELVLPRMTEVEQKV